METLEKEQILQNLTQDQYRLVLFDGVCNLCNQSVDFIIRRDPKAKFKFASLQSDLGQSLLQKHGLPSDYKQSVLLLEKDKLYEKSSAALRIARELKGGWPLLYGFIVIPKFIRNFVYNLIARNRYRLFGKKDTCRIPTPEERDRLLA